MSRSGPLSRQLNVRNWIISDLARTTGMRAQSGRRFRIALVPAFWGDCHPIALTLKAGEPER